MGNTCVVDEKIPKTENMYSRHVDYNKRVTTAVIDSVYIVMRRVVAFDWTSNNKMIVKVFKSHSKAVDYLTSLGCVAGVDNAFGEVVWSLDMCDGLRSQYTIEHHEVC